MHYLDTSLLVAALTREARTREIQEWLAEQAPGTLAISDSVITEFSGALALKVRTGALSAAQRADVVAAFTSLAEASLITLPVTGPDFRTAARFLDRPDLVLRSGDALHLAVAANHGARLCTLDRRQEEAAVAVGVSTV